MISSSVSSFVGGGSCETQQTIAPIFLKASEIRSLTFCFGGLPTLRCDAPKMEPLVDEGPIFPDFSLRSGFSFRRKGVLN